MVCEHLAELEEELLQSEIKEDFRGQAWTLNCHEWVYFRCLFDRNALRARLHFAPCVQDHEHLGTHDGHEAGFVCVQCKDAIMGGHPLHKNDWPMFN